MVLRLLPEDAELEVGVFAMDAAPKKRRGQESGEPRGAGGGKKQKIEITGLDGLVEALNRPVGEDATRIAAADSIRKTSEATTETLKALSLAQNQLAQTTDESMRAILKLTVSSLKKKLETLSVMTEL